MENKTIASFDRDTITIAIRLLNSSFLFALLHDGILDCCVHFQTLDLPLKLGDPRENK